MRSVGPVGDLDKTFPVFLDLRKALRCLEKVNNNLLPNGGEYLMAMFDGGESHGIESVKHHQLNTSKLFFCCFFMGHGSQMVKKRSKNKSKALYEPNFCGKPRPLNSQMFSSPKQRFEEKTPKWPKVKSTFWGANSSRKDLSDSFK